VTLLIALVMSSTAQASPPARPAPAKPPYFDQIACAPMALPAPPLAGLRVLGGYVHGRLMFAPGDGVIVSAGTAQGIQPGQQYFVRRQVNDASKKQPKVGGLYGIHTAGWVTIVDVKENMAIATVTHACDGIYEGDYLDPYVEPVLPSPALAGTPDFEHPGQIVMADERRQAGYPGLVMVMNRGNEQGVRAGQTLTLYRESLNGVGPIIDVGRATVLSAGPQSALVRIDSSREAVYVGDLVAIHRITP
jgi:hypothetical protein